jgi:hypothetical protein
MKTVGYLKGTDPEFLKKLVMHGVQNAADWKRY